MIRLERVTEEKRGLLYSINQKYLYEMTAFYDDPMDDEGNYHYGYFDAYFEEPEREALLIYDDEALVGFAMLNPYSYINEAPDCVMAEFTIFPAYRRRHLALQAAQAIIAGRPGQWELKYNERNAPAKALWTKLTAPHSPRVTRLNDEETVISFTVA